MAKIIESTPQRLAMQFSSNTLVLDRAAGTATLQRKMMFWSLKPVEKPLSEIADVTIDAALDRASGVEVCHAMLVMRAGEAWALAADDKKSAEAAASTIREFLGLKPA
jgi:hypothetical protein